MIVPLRLLLLALGCVHASWPMLNNNARNQRYSTSFAGFPTAPTVISTFSVLPHGVNVSSSVPQIAYSCDDTHLFAGLHASNQKAVVSSCDLSNPEKPTCKQIFSTAERTFSGAKPTLSLHLKHGKADIGVLCDPSQWLKSKQPDLLAFNTLTGHQLWEYQDKPTGNNLDDSPMFSSIAGDSAFLLDFVGNFVQLDVNTGKVSMKAAIPGFEDWAMDSLQVLVSEDLKMAYMVKPSYKHDAALVAFDLETKKVKWTSNLNMKWKYAQGPVVLQGDMLHAVVVDIKGNHTMVGVSTKTGKLEWKWSDTEMEIPFLHSFLIDPKSGDAVVCETDGTLKEVALSRVNSKGKRVWRVKLGAGFGGCKTPRFGSSAIFYEAGSPIATKDGKVIVGVHTGCESQLADGQFVKIAELNTLHQIDIASGKEEWNKVLGKTEGKKPLHTVFMDCLPVGQHLACHGMTEATHHRASAVTILSG
eukprot:TRINITY_DN12572_c0_g1_i1.p1 TRINITY_DN12572_c0_g1~~TRINITY_DN12572_c0_g1_i1.p1  ORF type:complete len:473 (-),score=42.72 TRINITY_DN12572_c0_g1_i1:545-1963(-)